MVSWYLGEKNPVAYPGTDRTTPSWTTTGVLVAVLQSHLECPSSQRGAFCGPIPTHRSSLRLEPLYTHKRGAIAPSPLLKLIGHYGRGTSCVDEAHLIPDKDARRLSACSACPTDAGFAPDLSGWHTPWNLILSRVTLSTVRLFNSCAQSFACNGALSPHPGVHYILT